jgi:hypothetical protein
MFTLILIFILLAVYILLRRGKPQPSQIEQSIGEIVVTTSVETSSPIVEKSELPPLPEPNILVQPDWMSDKEFDAYWKKVDRRDDRIAKKYDTIIAKIDTAHQRAIDETGERWMNDEISDAQHDAACEEFQRIYEQLDKEAWAEAEASIPPVPLPTRS